MSIYLTQMPIGRSSPFMTAATHVPASESVQSESLAQSTRLPSHGLGPSGTHVVSHRSSRVGHVPPRTPPTTQHAWPGEHEPRPTQAIRKCGPLMHSAGLLPAGKHSVPPSSHRQQSFAAPQPHGDGSLVAPQASPDASGAASVASSVFVDALASAPASTCADSASAGAASPVESALSKSGSSPRHANRWPAKKRGTVPRTINRKGCMATTVFPSESSCTSLLEKSPNRLSHDLFRSPNARARRQ